MGGFPVVVPVGFPVVVTDDQAVKKRNLAIILDLRGKLNVGVLSVEMFVKVVDFVFNKPIPTTSRTLQTTH